MANPEHLAKLKESVDAWNRWRIQNPDVRPNLAEANLRGMDLHKTNLGGADLRGADLSGANLLRADISDAQLRGTRLSEANLYQPEGLRYKAAADIQSITGQGSGRSYKYFLMLAGNTREVKGDRMVTRFVGEALGSHGISSDVAEDLVRAAATALQAENPNLTAYKLDNLIWNHQRNKEEGQKAPGSCHRASFGRS
jgi:uncharacterized protein YjbI with pentapeptide repeats